jgi:hypothetical protein
MPQAAQPDGVRCLRVTALDPHADCLRSLRESQRLRLVSELDSRGVAHCYDEASGCAYYLCARSGEILVWTWQPIASWWEATILRSLLLSLTQPLDDEAALQLFLRATNRRAEVLIAPRRPERAGSVGAK